MKIYHKRIFTHALRTALLLVGSFLIYEFLLNLEKKWNLENPKNKLNHFYQRKIYKLILIFIIDLIILYGIVIIFDIHH